MSDTDAQRALKGSSAVVGTTVAESTPAWPEPVSAPQGAPNVLLVVLDDTGYAQLGCYGSPIRTPTIDRLAAGGLRYRSMHTAALCAPTRACLLTGRNHHSVGMGTIPEFAAGYPGYDARLPRDCGLLPEILRTHGYSTFAVGKWHLTPSEHVSAAGPYDSWPLGRGFERFYGFMGAETSQYHPELVHDNHQVPIPATPEEGYHLTEDLVDHAIGYVADIRQVDPAKPFFLYLAFGATHAPHQVPRPWIDAYRGMFDDGWEAYRERTFRHQLELGIVPAGTQLPPPDPDVPSWGSLSADERRLYARMMEVFAGFLEHTDHHLGRLVRFLERTGDLDRTLVMVLSDNGASAEGGPAGSTNHMRFNNNIPGSLQANLSAFEELGGPGHHNHYPWGWAWAGDTPFRRWKRETYRGGTSDPLVVHWPDGIRSRGEVRHQYVHAIDVLPTVLEAVGIDPPEVLGGTPQRPIEGTSFAYTFDDPGARDRHLVQYGEMFAHRSIYRDGWRAVCPWPGPSFATSSPPGTPITEADVARLDADGWELYHVAQDFAEARNVSDENPTLLSELIALWYEEARRYAVLPLDGRIALRLAEQRPRPGGDRDRYVYYPGTQRVPDDTAAKVYNRSHRITVDVELPEHHRDGVLIAQGSASGGYCLFIQDRRLHYVHNYVGVEEHHLASPEAVPAGPVELAYAFEVTGPADFAVGRGAPGVARLSIAGTVVAEREIPVTTPILFQLGGGLEVGRDSGSPVTSKYRAPYATPGTIRSVVIEVGPSPARDVAAEARVVLGRD